MHKNATKCNETLNRELALWLLKEVATVANILIYVLLELKLNQKWIYYLAYTNVSNKN
jgi:hypothetical protein